MLVTPRYTQITAPLADPPAGHPAGRPSPVPPPPPHLHSSTRKGSAVPLPGRPAALGCEPSQADGSVSAAVQPSRPSSPARAEASVGESSSCNHADTEMSGAADAEMETHRPPSAPGRATPRRRAGRRPRLRPRRQLDFPAPKIKVTRDLVSLLIFSTNIHVEKKKTQQQKQREESEAERKPAASETPPRGSSHPCSTVTHGFRGRRQPMARQRGVGGAEPPCPAGPCAPGATC